MEPSMATVPVIIAGVTYVLHLRPDHYYSRIPIEIWRLLKTALTPLPPAESTAEDFTGCLGLCYTDFQVNNVILPAHPLVVSREKVPIIGLSSLVGLRLVYDFGKNLLQVGIEIPLDAEEEQYRKRRANLDLGEGSRKAKESRYTNFEPQYPENRISREQENFDNFRSGEPDDRRLGHPDDRRLGHPDDHRLGHPDDRRLGHPDDRRLGHPDDRRLSHPDYRRLGHPEDHRMGHPDDFRFDHSDDHRLGHPDERRTGHPDDRRLGYSGDHRLEEFDDERGDHREGHSFDDRRPERGNFDRAYDHEDRRPGDLFNQSLEGGELSPREFNALGSRTQDQLQNFKGRNESTGIQFSSIPGINPSGVNVREVFDDLQRLIEFQNQKLQVLQGLPQTHPGSVPHIPPAGHSGPPQTNKQKANNKKGGNQKQRQCFACKRWGHNTSECWVLFGEKKGNKVKSRSTEAVPWNDKVSGKRPNKPPQKGGSFGKNKTNNPQKSGPFVRNKPNAPSQKGGPSGRTNSYHQEDLNPILEDRNWARDEMEILLPYRF